MNINPKYIHLFVLSFISLLAQSATAQQITISGYVQDKVGSDPIIDATVQLINSNYSLRTNRYGYYSITCESYPCKIVFQAESYNSDTIEIQSKKDTIIHISLTKLNIHSSNVVIVSDKLRKEVNSTRISVINLKPANLRAIPTIGGELDIIKVAQLLPGVQKGAEGQSGFQVRGGDPDQNLILLDEATIYNISHLFGFFSVFIPESIEDMELYKGGFPAEYGGRLSSIMDLRMREGSKSKYSGSGGIGILSSRITAEGPLIKDKLSFIVSGRRTYIDQVFKLIKLPLPYYFYDMNAKLSYTLSKKDKLFYSFYLGNDVLYSPKINNDSGNVLDANFGFKLGNISNTLRWNHTVSPKLFVNTSFIYTRFKYEVSGDFFDNQIFIGSKIYDLGLKSDFNYSFNNKNSIKFGFSYVHHTFKPNVVSAKGVISEVVKNRSPRVLLTDEFGVYARNEQIVNSRIKLNYGVRFSGCVVKGKPYFGLEPRLAGVYEINRNQSIKIGVARMKQYLHLVSSGNVSLPTDLWYPVTKNVKPQNSMQYTLGYQWFIKKLQSLFSVETYYKTMENTTEYREGAVLLLNDNFENELLQGKGWAYGIEFLLKKDIGKWNGWVSYTLGKSERQFAELNEGKIFPAKYDRRHYFTFVGNYKINKRWEIGAVWVYNSGARFTAQVGQYFMPKPGYNGVDVVPIYTSRNAVQMSPSHRLDLNLIYQMRIHKKFKTELVLSMYNVYNRAEPFRVRVRPADTGLGRVYEQPGLFGRIGSIAFNFKF